MNELTTGLIGVAWVIGALVAAVLWLKHERAEHPTMAEEIVITLMLISFVAWPLMALGWSILRIVKELEKRER